ncbi:fumarylacetoacetase [Podospora didyma]|uniref:Fumarylacetoacetase n=1 Tax=Podospora didyma TaxID=330526 RepID=A0AAE0TWC1_9PEZI|nr:fumarylacetoacetase [Podospora didyma]
MTTSWLDIDPSSDFSLANIPFGVITREIAQSPHVGVAIGTYVLDLQLLWGLHPEKFQAVHEALTTEIFSSPTLNAFAELGRPAHRAVRAWLQDLLSIDTSCPELLRDNEEARKLALIPQRNVRMQLPMAIGDYTDFYAGYHHAHAVGVMFRGVQNALQPNYTHLPVGYHGRASSMVVSGTPIQRPVGQILLDPAGPTTAASRRLDIELELGCFIAKPNALGTSVNVADAEKEAIFGYVLLNDWSARDIQTWEYVPLGPFNGKNFATTISPWVVLADALEPFRTTGVENKTPLQDYLKEERRENVFDIHLEVDLTTPEGDTTTISRTSSKHLMWSFPQMIAHHTLGGCPLRTGDLLGSGTISGPGGAKGGECGSLLEITEGGKKEVLLYGMDARTFLKDGDTVTLRGSCGSAGAKVGFGECRGRVYTARR